MEENWLQVSRRRRGKNLRSQDDLWKNLDIEEEKGEPVPDVSARKQMQIIDRVHGIADILRKSVLLKDAQSVIMKHFDMKSEETSVKNEENQADSTEKTHSGLTIVGYGLGSFCASINAVHQLAFLVVMREAFMKIEATWDSHAVGSLKSRHICVEIYDPAMNKSDVAIANYFQLEVIQKNEHGRRLVKSNTVFFMPHCSKTLYQNVLACNWGPAIGKLVIIGNSFSAYRDRTLVTKEREKLLFVRVLPYLKEIQLSCGVAKSHKEYRTYEAAFNDLSVHIFPSQLLTRGLKDDTLLGNKMGAVATTPEFSVKKESLRMVVTCETPITADQILDNGLLYIKTQKRASRPFPSRARFSFQVHRSMKVRHLLGWSRPTDMAMSSFQTSKIKVDSLSINGLLSPESVAARSRNNNSQDMEFSHNLKSDENKPENAVDKVLTAAPVSREKRTPSAAHCSNNNNSSTSAYTSQFRVAIPTNFDKTPTASPPKVTFRKGEKSFLDFHQHYAITRHLGEGSYSTVKQVTHRKKGGFYACKIVDKLSLSDVDRAALSHEVRVLSSVNHVNIMRLYEVIEDDAKCYLVTELAEGGDLFDRIVKHGKFSEREAQKVMAALVEALYYCHLHNIIHRDVKPENVLLSGDDVKLCDFGFARQLNHQDDQASDSCGTPGYAAPEILDGRSYGLEVDVFSLGVVTYIMLCGYPPFPMKLAQLRTHRFNVRYPSKDWAAIHPDVKTLISHMLHVDPKERPTMAVLRTNPWVKAGRITLERLRRENEERQRLADLTRRQQAASAIRKKLVMGGFEAIKYGRNGLPHRTKLRLSTDGKVMSWQPKLLKRSLLRYQNARTFTSLFGISGKNNTEEKNSSALQDEGSKSETRRPAVGTSYKDESADACSTVNNVDGAGSTTDAINEKRFWWRSLHRERSSKTERTASGGFTRPTTTRQTASTPSSPITPPIVKVLRFPTPNVTLEHTESPYATSSDRLDDSIKLHDIRELLPGDRAIFFAGHAMNLPNSSKRAVDPACVLSVCTRYRELHLEFSNEGVRDGFMYLLQQATLPLHQCALTQSHLMMATATPPPVPLSLSSRQRGAMTPLEEEINRSSGPEVDEDIDEARAKEAMAARPNNQAE
ncbi:camk camk1 protein kinase [Plasmopara halstedii]|uniref:Camk camk1 protein kinase n=1 Tax=Plasmopara halstedii TaxID=4781 RepID=A0A0P1APB8_PLAHL|nr:camk camk1 protein kinase [Plasmopara halstedii]CEG42864.1 camk camk1 protein kinase [Plasmopara halstedii]|eukprot:XP_024579233.1 camk camk1 protein kinase [Plasmopara halstedii]